MRRSLRTALFSLLLVALYSCGGGKVDTTTIIVNAANYNAEDVGLVWIKADGDYSFETIKIVDGKGSIVIDVDEGQPLSFSSRDERASIRMGEGMIPGPMLAFYATKGTIEITFDQEEWPILTIKGGELNKDVNRYWSERGPLEYESFEITREQFTAEGGLDNPELKERGQKVRAAMGEIDHNFIVNNPNSIISVELLAGRALAYDIEEYEKIFNGLSKEVRESEVGKEVEKMIMATKSTAPGSPAPNFTKLDKDGNSVSLEDFRGSYLLIDFWGTWCQPCRQSHPHLVELYNKYSPLGLKFLNVAQESDIKMRDTWLAVIEEDGLVWTQILNNEGIEECDVVQLYSIKAFPSKVLIDKEGKIVDTFVGGGDECDQKLKEIFGQ